MLPARLTTVDALVIASRVTAATEARSFDDVIEVVSRTVGDLVDDVGFSTIVDALTSVCRGCGSRMCGCNIAVA